MEPRSGTHRKIKPRCIVNYSTSRRPAIDAYLSSAPLAIAMRFRFPRYVPNSREPSRMAPSTRWRESISRIRANRFSPESKSWPIGSSLKMSPYLSRERSDSFKRCRQQCSINSSTQMHVVLYPFHGMAARAQRLFLSNGASPRIALPRRWHIQPGGPDTCGDSARLNVIGDLHERKSPETSLC
jgi:hypothetical protein